MKTNIDEMLEELYSYTNFGIKLGLENIKKLCNALGNPQDKYEVIHIAGTNGKGSTTTTIATILQESGKKVGKYTSPHILKFNERITINNVDISDEDIVKYFELVKNTLKNLEIKPTFFEVTTAMMFKYFADMGVDYAIIETGMGGRFDATNICNDAICCITNVTIDHTEYLGNTVYEIAYEKAGIIKKCNNVVVADKNIEFLKAIDENKNREIVNVLDKYANATYDLDYENFLTKINIGGEIFEFSLFGDYQYKNFLVAYEVAKMLGIDDKIIKKAVNKVVILARCEVVSQNPTVIVDGAHNVAGMTELSKIIKNGYQPNEVYVITSILKDKDITNMLKIIETFSENIILTGLPNKRGLMAFKLYEYVPNGREDNYMIMEDMKSAYEFALMQKPKVIVVCGSFYTAERFKETVK